MKKEHITQIAQTAVDLDPTVVGIAIMSDKGNEPYMDITGRMDIDSLLMIFGLLVVNKIEKRRQGHVGGELGILPIVPPEKRN